MVRNWWIQEEIRRKPHNSKKKGLRDWGVSGPILSTVFLDAAKNNLSWSHWEQTPIGTQAVFSHTVPLEESHYRVNYCCVPGNDAGAQLRPSTASSAIAGRLLLIPMRDQFFD